MEVPLGGAVVAALHLEEDDAQQALGGVGVGAGAVVEGVLGAELYEVLLQPLAAKPEGKDLVVVADGELCRLPFEVLVEGDKYLIEKHRIRYAPSLSVLHAARQWHKARTPPDRPLFALGDPVFTADDPRLTGGLASRDGFRGEKGFARLEHSGREVEAIARLLKAERRDVLTGRDATPANLLKSADRLGRVRYVHFATHGEVGVAEGQQPALVLGLDADGKSAGGQRLRLDEIAGLRLNADLVVLSACETGKGRLHGGEGVSSLARAFLAAGSRGVVCSLWKVDDRQTSRLMTDLYGGMTGGLSAAEALRAAKRSTIRGGLPPLYWAPFIPIGE
jgi:CHAT domain-containing protein